MVSISLWRVTIVLSSTSNQAIQRIQGLWDGVYGFTAVSFYCSVYTRCWKCSGGLLY